MVLAHFELQYDWTGFDFGPLPRQLAWALLALNFSWTVLLLAIVRLVLYAARIIALHWIPLAAYRSTHAESTAITSGRGLSKA